MKMNIMKIDFPSKLSNMNVVLRKLKNKDKNAIFSIYSNEESAKLDDWIPMKTLDEAEKLINQSIQNFNNKSEFRYGIEDLSRKKLIGSCGVFRLDECNRKCMVFFQVHKDERNKGYATNAMGLIIKYIFNELNINRIEAYITPGNNASIRVLEKNGFIQEGILREIEFYKDKFWDGIVMAMIRKDHEKLFT